MFILKIAILRGNAKRVKPIKLRKFVTADKEYKVEPIWLFERPHYRLQ